MCSAIDAIFDLIVCLTLYKKLFTCIASGLKKAFDQDVCAPLKLWPEQVLIVFGRLPNQLYSYANSWFPFTSCHSLLIVVCSRLELLLLSSHMTTLVFGPTLAPICLPCGAPHPPPLSDNDQPAIQHLPGSCIKLHNFRHICSNLKMRAALPNAPKLGVFMRRLWVRLLK